VVLQHFVYSGFDSALTVSIVKSDTFWNTFAYLCIKYRSLTHQLHQIISRFYMWSTQTIKWKVKPRVMTKLNMTDTWRFCIFCGWEEFHLILNRYQNLIPYIMQSVSCVLTLLCFVLLWMQVFIDMIWCKFWRNFQ
jgi:hypothetical protein